MSARDKSLGVKSTINFDIWADADASTQPPKEVLKFAFLRSDSYCCDIM
jgi:hypothetical protein